MVFLGAVLVFGYVVVVLLSVAIILLNIVLVFDVVLVLFVEERHLVENTIKKQNASELLKIEQEKKA